MNNVMDIETYVPHNGDRYFFDANIWLYFYCPIGNHKQEIISNLVVEFPALSSLFGVSTGLTATLDVDIPSLVALLSSYEDITGQMVVTLPALKTLIEASQGGRFDSGTPTELDGTILKWVRPT